MLTKTVTSFSIFNSWTKIKTLNLCSFYSFLDMYLESTAMATYIFDLWLFMFSRLKHFLLFSLVSGLLTEKITLFICPRRRQLSVVFTFWYHRQFLCHWRPQFLSKYCLHELSSFPVKLVFKEGSKIWLYSPVVSARNELPDRLEVIKWVNTRPNHLCI